MTEVLITGAGGAIGIHMLATVLQQTNWNVVATDSFRHKGDFDRITTLLLGLGYDARNRVHILPHDLSVPFSRRQVDRLHHVDYIINLASLSDVEDSIQEPVPFIMNNTALVLNMLELARQCTGLGAFVQFSTDEVYGPDVADGDGHPEWDTILPSNPYAASKAAQEAIAISYWRSYGVPIVITNTMNNFGEMQGADKYPVKVQKAVADGRTVEVHTSCDGQIGSRHYIHSANAADAVLFILRRGDAYRHQSGQIDRPDRYNIVGDARLDNLEMAQKIAELMGKPLTVRHVNFHADRPGHDLHYGLDGSKMKAAGWKPPESFDASMARTIAWQKANKEWIS
ncbi:dTDP-glucose 4,6-dehydratase [Komagataeibacter oboediens DSM 11826]|uniref:NAD-dependent epimerase n=1 Tax=Komagataeibacter oboediens TaxID=65958 RepID=A0A318QTW9_9PROT|nr:GDP-mannose 4,6-dehydratase [Komagataeibacter oboediens]PYD81404.1 NAD-dependent epimerase [Komagataeibacter oboediens]GBR32277.1 dTDP-glucose 4,6-dehydratase [Komagataeibacter oboediens DSM 11826]